MQAAFACRMKARSSSVSWLLAPPKKRPAFSTCAQRLAARRSSSQSATPRPALWLGNLTRGGLRNCRNVLLRSAGHVECRLTDATTFEEDSKFDIVLADVPCSGTGTLGRNPEIRHRLRPEDLARQAARQHDLLSAALRAVRRGGRVVYSTCSLEPEENEQVVAMVLAENDNARQVLIEPCVESILRREGILTISAGADQLKTCLTPEGALHLLPGKMPTDGFFVALLEKTK